MFQTPTRFPAEPSSIAAGQPQHQYQLPLSQGLVSQASPQPVMGTLPLATMAPSAAGENLFGQQHHSPFHLQQVSQQQQQLLQRPLCVSTTPIRSNHFAFAQQLPTNALQPSWTQFPYLQQQPQQQFQPVFAKGSVSGCPPTGAQSLQQLQQHSTYAQPLQHQQHLQQPRPYGSPGNFGGYPLQHTASYAAHSPMGQHAPTNTRFTSHQSVSPSNANMCVGAGVWQAPVYGTGSLRADLQQKPPPFFTGEAASPTSDKGKQPESLSTHPSSSVGLADTEIFSRRLVQAGGSVPIEEDAPPVQPLESGLSIAGVFEDVQEYLVGATQFPEIGPAKETYSFPLAQSTCQAAVSASKVLSSDNVTNSVIIFGFPLTATSYILSQFRHYGDILRHKVSPDAENWISVTYATRLGAQAALSKNGRVFDGQIMIGVLPAPEDVAAENTFPAGPRMSASPTKDVVVPGSSPPRFSAKPPVDGRTSPFATVPPVLGSRQKVVPKTAQIFQSQSVPANRNQSLRGKASMEPGKDARKADVGVYQRISNVLWGW